MHYDQILQDKAIEFHVHYYETYFGDWVLEGKSFHDFIRKEEYYISFVKTLVKEFGAGLTHLLSLPSNSAFPLTKKIQKELLSHVKSLFYKSLNQREKELKVLLAEARLHTKKKISLTYLTQSEQKKSEWEQKKEQYLQEYIKVQVSIQEMFR